MRLLIRGIDILEAALPAGILLPGSRADQQQLCSTKSRTRTPASPASFPLRAAELTSRGTEDMPVLPTGQKTMLLYPWSAQCLHWHNGLLPLCARFLVFLVKDLSWLLIAGNSSSPCYYVSPYLQLRKRKKGLPGDLREEGISFLIALWFVNWISGAAFSLWVM